MEMEFEAEKQRLCTKYGVKNLDEVLERQRELLKEGE